MGEVVVYPIKRGTSFAQTWCYEIDNVRQDLTGTVITSQMRDIQGALVATFNCTLQDQSDPQAPSFGCFDIEMAGVIVWPVADYYQDIKYVWPNGRIETVPDLADDNIIVRVSESVTQV